MHEKEDACSVGESIGEQLDVTCEGIVAEYQDSNLETWKSWHSVIEGVLVVIVIAVVS